MNFFPRELCEKLEKLGCKSETEMFWALSPINTWQIFDSAYVADDPAPVPAFYQNDFTGCHLEAWGNMKVLIEKTYKNLDGWGEMARLVGYQRNKIIIQLDPAKYIEDILDGK
jgi:hypothetical protein